VGPRAPPGAHQEFKWDQHAPPGPSRTQVGTDAPQAAKEFKWDHARPSAIMNSKKWDQRAHQGQSGFSGNHAPPGAIQEFPEWRPGGAWSHLSS